MRSRTLSPEPRCRRRGRRAGRVPRASSSAGRHGWRPATRGWRAGPPSSRDRAAPARSRNDIRAACPPAARPRAASGRRRGRPSCRGRAPSPPAVGGPGRRPPPARGRGATSRSSARSRGGGRAASRAAARCGGAPPARGAPPRPAGSAPGRAGAPRHARSTACARGRAAAARRWWTRDRGSRREPTARAKSTGSVHERARPRASEWPGWREAAVGAGWDSRLMGPFRTWNHHRVPPRVTLARVGVPHQEPVPP